MNKLFDLGFQYSQSVGKAMAGLDSHALTNARESVQTAATAMAGFNNHALTSAWESIQTLGETLTGLDNTIYVINSMQRSLQSLNMSSASTIGMINTLQESLQGIALPSGFDSKIGDITEKLANLSEEYYANVEPDLLSEFTNDIESVEIQKENWEQRLYNCALKWKKKHPIFTIMVIFIISQISAFIFEKTISYGWTKMTTHLKQSPNASSAVMLTIPENSQLYIVHDIPYWLEIAYLDEGNETIVGWVSKRSVVNSSIPLGLSSVE